MDIVQTFVLKFVNKLLPLSHYQQGGLAENGHLCVRTDCWSSTELILMECGLDLKVISSDDFLNFWN